AAYEAQQQKQHFKAQAIQARRQERADRRGTQRQSFRAYWQENVNEVIESLAEHEGVLDACRRRGLQGMLAIRSIQMCVGMHLSYGYAQIVEPNTKIDEGDSRDIQHAIVASAADVFITHDKEFRKLLKRVPIEGFQVTGLRDFLGQFSV